MRNYGIEKRKNGAEMRTQEENMCACVQWAMNADKIWLEKGYWISESIFLSEEYIPQ